MAEKKENLRTTLVPTTIDQVEIDQPWRLQRHQQACQYKILAIDRTHAWVVNLKNGWQTVVDLSYKCKVYIEKAL